MVGTRPSKSSTILVTDTLSELLDGGSGPKQPVRQAGKKDRQRRRRKAGGSKETPGDVKCKDVAEGLGLEREQGSDQKDHARSEKSGSEAENVEEKEKVGGVCTVLEGEGSVACKLLEQVKLAEKDELGLVSEEEISRNRQEQEDEVVALESIYESRFRVLVNQGGDDRRFFKVEIPLEIGGTLEVSMRSSSSSSVGEPRFNSFKLEHLPPINLVFTFPSTYPSRSPPAFVLESSWLEAKKLGLLCDNLCQLWGDQKGEVIIYTWTDFLHGQALSSVGALERLVLDFQESHDARVVSGATSPEITAVSLLSYNEDMQQQSFFASFHTCEICFSEYSGRDFIKLPCEHAYCKSCLQQYSSIHVKEGSVTRLKCPDVECTRSIPPFVLKELLNKEEFERWDRMSLEKTEGVTYCPRCNTLCIPDEQHLAQCEKCFYSFCDLCRGTWHSGECLTPEARLKLLEQCGNSATTPDQARKRAELVNELKNLDYVRNEAKSCPVCGMAISKTGGCNKMNCINCGNKFCYRCGVQVDGYEHFREGACKLFGDEELRDWERNNNFFLVEFARHQNEELGMFPERARTCPSCRQRNLKVNNNNHVFCIFCQNHYCGVCHKIVRKSSEHFGPNKCKQHTPD